MYVIENVMFDHIGGGAPAGTGGTATAGTANANCPSGTIPVAVSGNVSGSIGGLTISGGGAFATCLPAGSTGGGGNGGGSGSGSSGGTLKDIKDSDTPTKKASN